MKHTFTQEELRELPIISFFDDKKVILRKGGKIFGSGPILLSNLSLKQFGVLEFYKLNEDKSFTKATEITYKPFPLAVQGQSTYLYLHNHLFKSEKPLEGNKKVIQLASCQFVGVFFEDNKPIALSPKFCFQSKKNLKKKESNSSRKKEKKASKRKRRAEDEEEEDEEEEEEEVEEEEDEDEEEQTPKKFRKMITSPPKKHSKLFDSDEQSIADLSPKENDNSLYSSSPDFTQIPPISAVPPFLLCNFLTNHEEAQRSPDNDQVTYDNDQVTPSGNEYFFLSSILNSSS